MSLRLPWWRRLHVRMALLVVVCIGASSIGLTMWIEQTLQRQHDADSQGQSLQLARYIADRQAEPLIAADGRVRATSLADLAMYVRMIQPSLEIYLLDRAGRILQHTLGVDVPRLEQVQLSALAPLLFTDMPNLPVYGDDPRRPEQRNLVSIAALPDSANVHGYLYVVLRGEQARLIQQQALSDLQRQTTRNVIVLSLAGAALVIVVAQTGITRRLRALADEMQRFRPSGSALAADLRHAHDEIDQVRFAAQTLQQRVVAQFQRLEDAERLRLELISNISHDLHTPLANVQGYIETMLVRGEQLSVVERERHLRTSLRHCRSLARRVAELFELSKLESGRAQIAAEPFCVAELVNDIVQSYELAAQVRGITLRLAADADRDAKVLADIGLIERVLQNLIDNALRHSAAQGLVELSVRADGAQILVAVRDNGQGIAVDDLPHIFQRYWTTATVPGGDRAAPSAGLGLAIARRIVELHGGNIGVRSSPNQGTEFSFALPASQLPMM
jgi:two-component system, OmpR family, sensor kinase